MILLDTNLLVYSANPVSRHFDAAERAVRAFATEAVLAPQCLYELWATATRPAPSGLGFTAEQTARLIRELRRSLRLLPDPPALLDLWLELVSAHDITGKRTHDARLVAFMRGHGLTRLATFNIDDFRAYPGLELTLPT